MEKVYKNQKTMNKLIKYFYSNQNKLNTRVSNIDAVVL